MPYRKSMHIIKWLGDRIKGRRPIRSLLKSGGVDEKWQFTWRREGSLKNI